MKRRKRSGFTLLEVVIAFVVVGMIASLVGGIVTNSYVLSSRLKKYPNAYYSAQGDLEKKIKELKSEIGKYHRATDAGEKKAIEEKIKTELGAVKNKDISIFGRTVSVYTVSVTSDSTDGVITTLYGGACDAPERERIAPAISEVTVKVDGDQKAAKYTLKNYEKKEDLTLRATATWDDSVNKKFQAGMLYQWYATALGYHTVGYDAHITEDNEFATTVASYPKAFRALGKYLTDDDGNLLNAAGEKVKDTKDAMQIVVGEKGATLKVTPAMRGKTYVCVVTPLSATGDMGDPKVSKNMIYVPNYPVLDSGVYASIMDASMQSINAPGTEEIKWDSNPAIGKIPWSVKGSPMLNTLGESTWDDANPYRMNAHSRFITLTQNNYLELKRLSDGNYSVFAVVKAPNGEQDFKFAEFDDDETLGFEDKVSKKPSVSGWCIVYKDFEGVDDDFKIQGKDANLNVAELIVVKDANANDKQTILSYLSKKYSISIN